MQALNAPASVAQVVVPELVSVTVYVALGVVVLT